MRTAFLIALLVKQAAPALAKSTLAGHWEAAGTSYPSARLCPKPGVCPISSWEALGVLTPSGRSLEICPLLLSMPPLVQHGFVGQAQSAGSHTCQPRTLPPSHTPAHLAS